MAEKTANNECPICMDQLNEKKNFVITECGHKMCFTCMAEHIAKNPRQNACPICRSNLYGEQTVCKTQLVEVTDVAAVVYRTDYSESSEYDSEDSEELAEIYRNQYYNNAYLRRHPYNQHPIISIETYSVYTEYGRQHPLDVANNIITTNNTDVILTLKCTAITTINDLAEYLSKYYLAPFLQNITKLICDNRHINKLGEIKTIVANLTYFSCQNCQISEYIDCRFKFLKYINCSNNNIEGIFCDGINLKTLILSNNKITSMNHYNMANSIEELDVSHNLITGITNFPTQIKKLDISFNKIDDINLNCLKDSGILDYFNCANNLIIYIKNLSYLKTRTFICNNNKIQKLNLNIHLETLIAHNNDLTEINLAKCVNLLSANLTNNKLSTLDIKNSKKMRSLFVENNNLHEIILLNTNIMSNRKIPIFKIAQNKFAADMIRFLEQYGAKNS
jgi:hypothetical protein